MVSMTVQTNKFDKYTQEEKKIFQHNGKPVMYTIKRTYLGKITQKKMIENIIRQHIDQ